MEVKMQKLQCELCGSVDLIKTEQNVFQCQYCGCKYTLEQAQKLIFGGEVKTKATDFEIVGGVLKKYNGEDVDVVVPDNVTVIGLRAFQGLKGLKSVKLHNKITEIEESAFENCTGLTSITIPNSVKSIGTSAFRECSGLTTVTISNSVKNIGWSAFGNCTSLTTVTITADVSVDAYAFEGTPYLDRIYAEERKREEEKQEKQEKERIERFRRSEGLCLHCGGTFKGIFNQVCRDCARPKDY